MNMHHFHVCLFNLYYAVQAVHAGLSSVFRCVCFNEIEREDLQFQAMDLLNSIRLLGWVKVSIPALKNTRK